VGAAVFVSEGRRATTGAALGSTAAVVAAFAGEWIRALAVEKTGFPDPVVALAEDATVLLVGLRSLRNVDNSFDGRIVKGYLTTLYVAKRK
jgi:hypothetical protein